MMLWFSIHCKSLIAIATRPKLVLLWTPVILATVYIAVIVGLSTFVRCLYSHISWWIIDRSTYLTMTIKDTVIEHKDPQSLWYKGGKSLRDSFEYTEGPFHPTRHLNIRPDSHSADQSKLIRRTTCYLHIKFSPVAMKRNWLRELLHRVLLLVGSQVLSLIQRPLCVCPLSF